MRKYFPWLACLLILIVGFGTIYASVQQSQRSAANWPQIQMAEDTANSLNRGDVPSILVHNQTDMSTSLAPFTIIYDKKGNAVGGSGLLNGKVPKVPLGVLTGSHNKEYNAVTWQPNSDVRIAAVSVEANKYYVLSGRNLRQVEKDEDTTLKLSVLGGLISTVLLWGIFIYSNVESEEY